MKSPHLEPQTDPKAWTVDTHGRLCDERGMMLDARTAADRYNAMRFQYEGKISDLEHGEFICKKCGLRKDGEHEHIDF